MPRDNATYAQIWEYVKEHYGYSIGSNCIAEAKERVGLAPRKAHNRIDSEKRITECPHENLQHIYAAFQHFGMPHTPKPKS